MDSRVYNRDPQVLVAFHANLNMKYLTHGSGYIRARGAYSA